MPEYVTCKQEETTRRRKKTHKTTQTPTHTHTNKTKRIKRYKSHNPTINNNVREQHKETQLTDTRRQQQLLQQQLEQRTHSLK